MEIIYRILTIIHTIFILILGIFICNKIKDNFYKYLVGFLAGTINSVIAYDLFLVYLKAGGTI